MCKHNSVMAPVSLTQCFEFFILCSGLRDLLLRFRCSCSYVFGFAGALRLWWWLSPWVSVNFYFQLVFWLLFFVTFFFKPACVSWVLSCLVCLFVCHFLFYFASLRLMCFTFSFVPSVLLVDSIQLCSLVSLLCLIALCVFKCSAFLCSWLCCCQTFP